MIEVRGFQFDYPGGSRVFDGFDWSVARGETWAVVGPSGCGKTTLLYCLAGLRRPTGGEVRIDGTPIAGTRLDTGLILQDYGLLPWETGLGNVRLGLKLRDIRTSESEARVESWLLRLGVWEVRNQYPLQLSGGQRQRIAIARTLVLNPDLLLMDEPFSALDAFTREDLQSLVASIQHQSDRTTVLVTHDIAEAVFLGRKILVLPAAPVRETIVVDNPEAMSPEYRDQPEFFARCSEVRSLVTARSASRVPAGAPC